MSKRKYPGWDDEGEVAKKQKLPDQFAIDQDLNSDKENQNPNIPLKEYENRRKSLRLSGGKVQIDTSAYPSEPKNIRRSSSGNNAKVDILTLRTKETAPDEKTHAYFLGLAPNTENRIQQILQENVPSNRPAAILGSPSPRKGRPNWVQTPNGTKLNRIKDHGVMLLFSNKAPNTNDPLAVKADETYLKEKTQTVHLTEELIDRVCKERRQCNDKRPVSQNKLMKGSAADAAEGFKKSYDKWEWLHLIAWSILGKQAQNAENLVAGVNHPNTDMIFIEREIPELVKLYKEGGIDLEVKATLEPNKQVARTIYYTIKTPDFELCFEFDARNRTRPSRVNGEYFHALIEGMVEETQKMAKDKAVALGQPDTVPHQQKVWKDRQGKGDITPRVLF